MSNININNLTDKEVKNLEARLRRKLEKDGEILKKGKSSGFPGYMIVDANTNVVVAGGEVNGFNLSLDEVVKYTETE